MLKRCLFAFVGAAGLAVTPVAAQERSVRLHGTIAAVEGLVVVVNTVTGTARVTLDEHPRVTLEEPADLAAIKPGDFIGSGAVPQPDGTQRAVAVHIFAESMRGAGEGFRPWTGAANGTMTNATVHDVAPAAVEGVSGRVLTLTYNGGAQKLFIPPGTPIVRSSPGDRTLIAVGAHVSVNAAKHVDGSLSAAAVTIGKNGFAPV